MPMAEAIARVRAAVARPGSAAGNLQDPREAGPGRTARRQGDRRWSPGTSQAVVLSPGDANSLTGKLPAAAAGKTTTVLSLTVSGKTAQARFASAQ